MDITIKGVDNGRMLILLSKLDKVNDTMVEALKDERMYLFDELNKLIQDITDEVDEKYVSTLVKDIESLEEEEEKRRLGLI